MKKFFWLVLCSLLLGFTATAQAQAPFYQGKTIRVLVGTPPGNLYDFWARLIVDHMGRHIPGNPSFIV
ncbi:MAG: Bug family tripartite tricarboxylate transporter substrate binding protein, partial [Candidatus Binatia bacterium]